MMELKIMEPAAFAAADLSLFTVVDMREEGVPPSLRIPGAVEIPFSRWFSEADKIPKEKPVLLLCQIGKCSELAGEIIRGTVADGDHVIIDVEGEGDARKLTFSAK